MDMLLSSILSYSSTKKESQPSQLGAHSKLMVTTVAFCYTKMTVVAPDRNQIVYFVRIIPHSRRLTCAT